VTPDSGTLKTAAEHNIILCFTFAACRYAKGSTTDQCSVETRDKDINGKEIGAQAESVWLRVVPWSFYKLLKYVQDRCGSHLDVM
jgi:hypothetical protein